MIDQEIQFILDEKQDAILTGMPAPQDGKVGDIRTNVFHGGNSYMMMKAGVAQWVFSSPFTQARLKHTLKDYLLLSSAVMLDTSLLDAYNLTVRNDLLLSGPTAGTDNTVLVLNGADGMVVTDEIDPRVWGSALVDKIGGALNNQIATFIDGDTIQGESRLTWDGASFKIIAPNANAIIQSWTRRDSGASWDVILAGGDLRIARASGPGDIALGVDGIGVADGSNVGIGLSPTANMTGLALEGGVLTLKEITTPTADTNYGKFYTKTNNKAYFQDGAGAEHELAFI